MRAYDPTLGRFLSRDPLGRAPLFVASNPYVYAGNNPLSNVDPSGLRYAMSRGSGVRVQVYRPRHSPAVHSKKPAPSVGIPPDAMWRWQVKGETYQIWIKGPETDKASGYHYNLHVQHYGGSVELHNYHLTWGGEIPPNCPGENDPTDPNGVFGDYVWKILPDTGSMASPQVNGDGFIRFNRSVGIAEASALAATAMTGIVLGETKQWGAFIELDANLTRVFSDLAKQGGERV